MDSRRIERISSQRRKEAPEMKMLGGMKLIVKKKKPSRSQTSAFDFLKGTMQDRRREPYHKQRRRIGRPTGLL